MESGRRRQSLASDNIVIREVRAWGPAVLWAVVLFLLSAWPDGPGREWLPWLPGKDKIAHVVLYSVFGGTLAHVRRYSSFPVSAVLVIAVGLVYGLTDEWHQSFVPGRDPSLWDWVADAVGVIVGYGIVTRWLRPSRDSTNRQIWNT